MFLVVSGGLILELGEEMVLQKQTNVCVSIMSRMFLGLGVSWILCALL